MHLQGIIDRSAHLLWIMLLCSPMLMVGCASQSFHKADLVIPDVHGGGSALAINPGSSIVATGGWNGRIRLWSLPQGESGDGWQGHRGEVTTLFFLDNEHLLSAGYDGRLTEWTVRGHKIRDIDTASPVLAMAVDRSKQRILTGHGDGSVRLWSLPDITPERTLGRQGGKIRAVSISPTGDRFASSATDGKVKLWDMDGSSKTLPSPGTDARTLAFSTDGNRLFGAGWFDLYRWDLDLLRLTTLDTDHRGVINSIVFDPKGSYLASISRQTDSSVLTLNPETGETIQRFQSHTLCGGAVTLAPNGKIMASTADDASLMIWELK